MHKQLYHRKKWMLLALIGSILHFSFSMTLIDHVSTMAGSRLGEKIAADLVAGSRSPDPFYFSDDTKNQAYWSNLILSVPIKRLIEPYAGQLRKNWAYEPAVSGSITFDQFIVRSKVVNTAITALNSIAFGALIYFASWLASKVKKINGFTH